MPIPFYFQDLVKVAEFMATYYLGFVEWLGWALFLLSFFAQRYGDWRELSQVNEGDGGICVYDKS